ncbi:hypothetical protein [Shewanella scandinavica]|uniref:hypothetical protein n=1 Tax=Shewanella scandinavica TaxID=3063538 RepID=UPI00318F9B34
MDWDINDGSYVYHGVALDTKPQIEHIVRLCKSDYEFDIKIVDINGDLFQGNIVRIGPEPALGTTDLKRGDLVFFKDNNIQRLSSNA